MAPQLRLPPPQRVAGGVELAATSGGFAIRLHEAADARQTRVSVGLARDAVPLSLRWAPTTGSGVTRASLVHPDGTLTITGDVRFDEQIEVEGDEALACAVLDSDTRAAVLRSVGVSCTVELGTVQWLHASTLRGAWIIARLLEDMKSLARRFGMLSASYARLETQVESDPEPGVRARCLSVLAAHYPERVAPVARRALVDDTSDVRILAATLLGDEGTDALLELVELSVDNGSRRRAIRVLARRLSPERMVQLTDEVLPERSPDVVAMALRALQRTVQKAPPESRLLGEGVLVRALEHPDLPVRVTAAKVLGAIGSIAAVGPLRTAIDARRFDVQFDRPARHAIARIRSRTPGASSGQLSLASSEEGRLSLSDEGPSGHVSLADDE